MTFAKRTGTPSIAWSGAVIAGLFMGCSSESAGPGNPMMNGVPAVAGTQPNVQAMTPMTAAAAGTGTGAAAPLPSGGAGSVAPAQVAPPIPGAGMQMPVTGLDGELPPSPPSPHWISY